MLLVCPEEIRDELLSLGHNQFYSVVKSFLVKYVNFVGGEWDLYLNEMCYAYNTSVHSSTGFPPAELTFGRKLRIPIDIIWLL